MSDIDQANLASPISGYAVCQVLGALVKSDSTCLLRDIETLCSVDCDGLGVLWNEIIANGSTLIRVDALVQILSHADQVICLDLCIAGDEMHKLVIDDGDLIENRL